MPTAMIILGLALIGGDGPSSLVEVDAGRHDRLGAVVTLPLPASLREVRSFRLDPVDGPGSARAAIPGQRVDGPEPAVAWIIPDLIPAGGRRRYRLAADPDPPPPTMTARSDPDGLTVDRAGRPALGYRATVAEPPAGIDPVYRRGGFIHPLTTPSGRVVTDDFPPDHAHQHGLFFAWVNTTHDGRSVDFWNQPGRTGRVGPIPGGPGPSTVSGPVFAGFTDRLRHDDLTAPGGPVAVLDETWTVRVYATEGPVLIDFESVLTAAGPHPLTVNAYHYGGLGLRGNRHWTDPLAKGTDPPDPARSGRAEFLTSEGRHRLDGNHTRPAWVDISGEVDGRPAGVAVLDHPSNFRSPQPVRLHPNMPYLSLAPPVLGRFEIRAGHPYTSRFRLVVHDGRPDPAALDRLRIDFADPPTARIVP